jgi:hypothetical protein
LKKRLTTKERKGLTASHAKEADLYLKSNPSSLPIPPKDAIPLYELFLLGYSPEDISKRYPQYPLGLIVYTATQNNWIQDRDQMAATVYDRIKTRLVRSTVEQVEFLTDMIAVCSIETQEQFRRYLQDPKNNPLPDMRIESIKDYRAVMEMMSELATTVQTLASNPDDKGKKRVKSQTESQLLAELVEDPDDVEN